ncbi:MAG: tetratricopeptide repeat protein [Flavobacteriales bacterium]|nr:tetratricopeptide repeat protein [Flavobacteriales bacterium]
MKTISTLTYRGLLVVLTLVGLFASTYAQDRSLDVRHSLQVVDDSASDAGAKLEACVVLAGHFSTASPEVGLHFGRRGLALAQTHFGLHRTEMLLNCMGLCALNLGRPDTAYRWLRQAQRRSFQVKDTRAMAMSSLCLGLYNFQMNYMDSAKLYLEDAIQNALLARDMDIAYRAKLALGLYLTRQGDYLGALFNNKAAYDYFREVKDLNLMAVALCNSAVVLNTVGQYPSAHDYYMEGLKVIGSDTCNFFRAKVYANMGSNFKDWLETDSAVIYLDRARQAFEKAGARKLATACTNNLGEVYFSQGAYPKAIAAYMDARKNMNADNSAQDLAMCDHNIARAVIEIFMTRAPHFDRPLLLSDTVHVDSMVISLGACLETFQAVLGLLDQQRNHEFSSEVFHYMARSYYLLGDSINGVHADVISNRLNVSTATANLVHELVLQWDQARLRRAEQERSVAQYRTILKFGVFGILGTIILILLVRIAPSLLVIRLIFFVQMVFIAEWLKMLSEHWILRLVGGNITYLMLVYLAFGTIAMLVHVYGTAAFHAFLERKSDKRKLEKKPPQGGNPPNSENLRTAA